MRVQVWKLRNQVSVIDLRLICSNEPLANGEPKAQTIIVELPDGTQLEVVVSQRKLTPFSIHLTCVDAYNGSCAGHH